MGFKKNSVFFALIFVLSVMSFRWYSTAFEQLLSNLSKLTDAYPQEKVHLHTDKPYYAVGEDIWLKGYVVTAEKNEPSLLSAVLYVDLADERNVIKKSITLPVVKGIAQGNLFLVDSLVTGKYRLRAYTNYMRNYDEGFFFEKLVEVGNVLDKLKAESGKDKAESEKQRDAYELPKASPSGYVLSVNQVNESLKINIGCSADQIGSGNVHVVAQANGKAYASFTTKADKAMLSASIAKKMFPTGIVHITLFNAENKPLAERLVFVNHNDLLNIAIENLTPNSTTKQKTNLAFTVKDIAGNPIDGNFSVSVTDAGKVPYEEDDETTILSNLLFTSDLKGYVEQPNYYFNGTNTDKARQLDNLLLTQGWRRFKWEDIATGKEPDLTFRPEQSLEITGKTLTAGNKPLPHARVTLVSSTQGFQLFLDTISDARGNFVFDRLDVPDSATFIVQAKGNKDNKNINISINQRAGVRATTLPGRAIDMLPYLAITKARYEDLDKHHVMPEGIKIKEVTIKAPKLLNHETVLNVKNSTNASGVADYVIKKEQLEYELSIAGALQKVPGVHTKTSLTGSTSTLFILDGTPLPKDYAWDILNAINPRDVEGIEVLTRSYNTAIYGSDGIGGVIHITTKKGDTNKPIPATNIGKAKNRGYTVAKEFYAPDYDDPKTNKAMQDLRTIIFWKPVLETDKDGKANLSYFNAGTPGNYKVIVEGMDRFGNIGRKVFNYEVK